MIKNGYLEIEYRDRLPVLNFSEIGWKIEMETYVEELLQKLVDRRRVRELFGL